MAALVITIFLNTKSDFYFQFANYEYEFHQYEFNFLRQWHLSSVKFEQISHIILVFLLLVCKCQLGGLAIFKVNTREKNRALIWQSFERKIL